MAVFVDVAGQSVAEQSALDNSLVFTISLSEPSAQTVTLPYRYFGGTAEFGSRGGDFSTSSARTGTVRFDPGEVQQTVTVRIEADSVPEPDESVILEVGAPSNASLFDDARVARAVGWILDDDNFANPLALHVSNPLVFEGDGAGAAANFEFELSRAAPADLDISYATVSGSAEAGADFSARSGTLQILDGQRAGDVSAPVTGDNAVEGLERFDLSVVLPDEIADATGGRATIVDDDLGGPLVLVSGDRVAEQTALDNFMMFSVQLSAPSATRVTVPYRYFGGTAVFGSRDGDFSTSNAQTGTVTFEPGETLKTVSARIEADSVSESDESVIFEAGAPIGALLPGDAPAVRAVGWILDDDNIGERLAMATLDPIVLEGNAGPRTAGFDLELSRPAAGDLSIDHDAGSGSATPGADFAAESGTTVIRRGQQTASIGVDLIGDARAEAFEFIDLSLDLPAGITESIGSQATIVDDDGGLPVVLVSGSRVSEQSAIDNFMAFVVSLSKAANSTVTVPYTYFGGTAVFGRQGGDFSTSSAQSGTLTFRPGETQKVVSARVEADSAPEPDESVIFEVGLPTGAALPNGATKAQAIGWIMDDDGFANPTALQVGNPSVRERDIGAQTASFDFELSRPATSDLTIDYSTQGSARAGSDFVATTGSVVIERGQDAASVGVEVLGGFLFEQPETLSLALIAPPGALAARDGGVATILDNDPQPSQPGPLFQVAGLATPAFGRAGGWTTFRHERAAADVNGDGRADIVGFGDGGALVGLAQPGGRFAAPIVGTPAFGALGGWTARAHERVLADVNGDGRADIVGFGDGGALVSLALSDGRFAAPKMGTPAFGALGGWSTTVHEREVGDVDGDGRADIVGFGDGGVLVSRGRGDGSFIAPFEASAAFGALSGWTARVHERELADVNGDGRDDVVGFGDGGVLVALARADGRFAAPTLTTEAFGLTSGWRATTRERTTGDVNGDGRADLIGFGDGETLVALAEEDGDFEAVSLGTGAFATRSGFAVAAHERLVADVNGDGRDDVLGFGDNGVIVGLSIADALM